MMSETVPAGNKIFINDEGDRAYAAVLAAINETNDQKVRHGLLKRRLSHVRFESEPKGIAESI